MRIAIMQPGYIPWLGFFELMANCEIFVLLDDVQYDKKSWRNRNKIRTINGWMWLTVPVLQKNRRGQKINEVIINNDYPWKEKHLKALKFNYAKSGYYSEYIGFFERLYKKNWYYLVDLDIEIISFMTKSFDINTKIVRSSALEVPKSSGNTHIINICKSLKAEKLYDSNGARVFIKTELFQNNGIEVTFQDYKHPIYRQIAQPFLPCMSAVDLLFNEGPDSKRIMLNG